MSSKSFLKHLNELGNYEANTSGNGTTQVHNIAKPVNNFSLGTETCVDARPSARRKASRLGKPVIKEENLESFDNSNLAACCRYDSSLGLLTKFFIKLIQEADDGTLDLNRTAEVLGAGVERPHAEERGIDNSIRDKLDHLSELGSNLNCQKNLVLTGDDLMSLPCFKRDKDYRLKSDHEVSAIDMWGKE
ncbi:Hypothetical predicted protein, partial [Olea europaea subsp. europaea]